MKYLSVIRGGLSCASTRLELTVPVLGVQTAPDGPPAARNRPSGAHDKVHEPKAWTAQNQQQEIALQNAPNVRTIESNK